MIIFFLFISNLFGYIDEDCSQQDFKKRVMYKIRKLSVLPVPL